MSLVQNENFLQIKKACRNYLRTLEDIATRSILLVAGVIVLNVIILYFYNILWHIYRLTYIGKQFVILHPETTRMISSLLGNDIVELSVHTTLTAFEICMIISAICQISYISRFFYYHMGLIGKFSLWGMGLTVVVSIHLNGQHGFENWEAVIPIAIVPTLCVFAYCFQFSDRLLPEIGDVIGSFFRFVKWVISKLAPTKKHTDPISDNDVSAGSEQSL